MTLINNYLNKKEAKQFGIYVVVGLGTYLVDYTSYSLLVSAGILYAFADTINIPIVLGFNFIAHKTITFNSKVNKRIAVPKYILNSIFLYVYSLGILIVFVEIFQFTPSVAKIFQLVTIPMFNYIILRNIVFRD